MCKTKEICRGFCSIASNPARVSGVKLSALPSRYPHNSKNFYFQIKIDRNVQWMFNDKTMANKALVTKYSAIIKY